MANVSVADILTVVNSGLSAIVKPLIILGEDNTMLISFNDGLLLTTSSVIKKDLIELPDKIYGSWLR